MAIGHSFWSAIQATHRLVCLVRGHELVMQYDRNLLSLRCIVCGYRTSGWTVGELPQATGGTVVPLSTPWRAKGRRAA